MNGLRHSIYIYAFPKIALHQEYLLIIACKQDDEFTVLKMPKKEWKKEKLCHYYKTLTYHICLWLLPLNDAGSYLESDVQD